MRGPEDLGLAVAVEAVPGVVLVADADRQRVRPELEMEEMADAVEHGVVEEARTVPRPPPVDDRALGVESPRDVGRRRKAVWPVREPAHAPLALAAFFSHDTENQEVAVRVAVEVLRHHPHRSPLDLEELPRSLLVIGGGYIGAELAQMFARTGVKVTLVCRSRLLPEAESEIGTALTGYFEDEGITVVSGVAYRAIRKAENGVALDVSRDGQNTTIDADQVLITTGRAPNIEGLGLIEHGIALSPKGGIVVDDRMRTTRAGIYAAGDVTGRDQFVYMAAYGAKLAAKNSLNGDSLRYDNSAMPVIVFTDPQVASVGLTEDQAKEAGHEVKVGKFKLGGAGASVVYDDRAGLVKIVGDTAYGEILGAHIVGNIACDMISEVVNVMALEGGYPELARIIHPHPTMSEAILDGARAVEGWPIHA